MVNFNRKLAITQLVYKISSRLLGQIGVLGVGHFDYESVICARPIPVAMVMKICKFSHKICYKSGQI